MFRPRWTLSHSLILIGVVAINLAATPLLTYWLGHSLALLLNISVVPTASLVVCSDIKLVQQLVTKGTSGRFLLGFAVTGNAVVLAMTTISWLHPEWVDGPYIEWIFDRFKPLGYRLIGADWDRQRTLPLEILAYGLAGVALNLPQVGVALLGGGLCCVLRLQLVRQPAGGRVWDPRNEACR